MVSCWGHGVMCWWDSFENLSYKQEEQEAYLIHFQRIQLVVQLKPNPFTHLFTAEWLG